MKKKSILAALLVFVCTFMYAQTAEQSRKALAMLNHLVVQSQLILESKNNRVMLDEVYDNFINNITLEMDRNTQAQISMLLDTIHEFRMIKTDREHLQILFENDQAQAFSNALPNPTYLLSAVVSADPLKTIAAVAMTGLSAWTNYNHAKNDANLANLKATWELDKAEENEIHKARTNTFQYMTETVSNYPGIQSSDVLREENVKQFVKLQNTGNLHQRVQLLKGAESKFRNYAPYWGLLAKTFFDLDEFDDCLKAIAQYEKNRADIFEHDFDFINVLPCAILSLEEVYEATNKRCISETERYLKILEKETPLENWRMRYFITQTYISLAKNAKNTVYLQKAYDICSYDVVRLANKQDELIKDYLEPIDETIAKNLTSGELKKRKEEIKRQKELKAVARIPYHEGFWQNYILFEELADKLNLSHSNSKKYADTYSALLTALSIYAERDFVIENKFDNKEILKYLEPYRSDISPQQSMKIHNTDISLQQFREIYNIFSFRRKFDRKNYATDTECAELMKEIVTAVSMDKKNYYLPSLYNSVCYYVDPLLGAPKIELIIPLCLLRDNSKISYRIWESTTTGEDYTIAFEDDDVNYTTSHVKKVISDSKACYDSPIYFQQCIVTFNPKSKISFDKKKSYVIDVRIKEKDTASFSLRYHNVEKSGSKSTNFSTTVDW